MPERYASSSVTESGERKELLRKFHSTPLYFLHITKTAGTTVTATIDRFFRRSGLQRYYCRERICGPQQIPHIRTLPRDRIDTYSFYRGHYGLFLERLLQRPVHCVTLLRDPVARVISHYEHIVRAPDTSYHEYIVARGMSLANCLDDSFTRPMFTNLQARQLGWAPSRYDRKEILETDFAPWEHPTKWPCEFDEDELADRAIETIDRCRVVGTTERVDAFFESLCHEMNLCIDYDVQPPRMVGHYDREMYFGDHDLLKTIQSVCKADTVAYEYAVKVNKERETNYTTA